MIADEIRKAAVRRDPATVAFYLRVPKSHVVLLQAYFELYDGVGTVTTMQADDPVVCVMTSITQQDDCIKVLEAIRGEILWQITSWPTRETTNLS